MKLKIQLLLLTFFCIIILKAQPLNHFTPGEIWKDNNGQLINAHGGGILFHEGIYYWYGEHKITGKIGNSAQVGVHVYSSTDLYNWKDEGIALKINETNLLSDIAKGCILERPKVIYNVKTKKYVMWFHLELKDKGYLAARSGVAVSDNPTGPFTYLKSFRPNAGSLPINIKSFSDSLDILERDLTGGQMARDMNLFVDNDGTAYQIYTSEENRTVHISKLTDDYLSYSGKYIRTFPGRYMEGTALCKRNGKYYMFASGCSGWTPNAARSAVSDSIFGNWKELGNPCVGKDSSMTFHSQSTFVLPVQGKSDTYIFMADRWNPENPIDGRYIWLPITFENNKPAIKWMDSWKMKNDSVTSLNSVEESYKLSGKNLAALAEKILYKKTPQEDMYLYLLRPMKKTKKALPAIVYFTGGGWVNGDVYGQIPNPAWFRDHGIIGIEADYRVKSRHGTSPLECIQDAKSAIRYVRAHAKELGIDPDRIIAAGGSAGGHIAACTFLVGGDNPEENLKISSKPNALVLHNPGLGEGFGKEFFDVHPEFSPILNVKKGWPPTILCNGTIDRTTPFKTAEKFNRLMKETGNICELVPVIDADHSCDWPVSNPNFLPDMQRMLNFLKEQKIIK